MMNKTEIIIVTGATGFVGRRLIRILVETYGVSNILCLAYDQADNELERTGRSILNELGVQFIPVDLVTGRGLENVPKSPKMVFHLASNTETGASDHSINDIGTKNLLEAISPMQPNSHFVFTSTIAVSDHREDDSIAVDENTPLLTPFSDYGRRKLIAESYLRACALEMGFSVSIVRLSAVFGCGTRNDGLFASISKMVTRNAMIARLNYPGKLSFINVDDIAAILVMLSKREWPSKSCELYIPICETMTIAELIHCYSVAYDIQYRPIHLPQFFWGFCDLIAKFFYRIEFILPHSVNNRIWQIGLVVGSGFHNQSRKIFLTFPTLKLKRFKDVVIEMISS